MRFIPGVLVFLLLLGTGCASSSQETRTPAKTDSVAASPDKAKPQSVTAGPAKQQKKTAEADPSNQLICENEMQVGSHIPKRVCRTAWQIEEAARGSQEFFERPKPCGDIKCRGN